MRLSVALIIATLIVALALGMALLIADAQEYKTPDIPDEATKIRALKRAYEINGNSMVGDGRMIDVSKEDLSEAGQARLPPVSEISPKKVKKP